VVITAEEGEEIMLNEGLGAAEKLQNLLSVFTACPGIVAHQEQDLHASLALTTDSERSVRLPCYASRMQSPSRMQDPLDPCHSGDSLCKS